MNVFEPESRLDFEKYYDLRWRILRKPWNQPKGSEKDELEGKSSHVMVCEEDRIPLGVGRLHLNSSQEAQIRYMAVEEEFQGKGIGALLLNELERKAKEKGAKHIVLNSRESAVNFYKKHGYRIIAKAHTLFGAIPHYKMEKEL